MNTISSINDLGVRAKKAASLLANISNDQKNEALQHAQSVIESNFSKINMINQYLKLYESVKS